MTTPAANRQKFTINWIYANKIQESTERMMHSLERIHLSMRTFSPPRKVISEKSTTNRSRNDYYSKGGGSTAHTRKLINKKDSSELNLSIDEGVTANYFQEKAHKKQL